MIRSKSVHPGGKRFSKKKGPFIGHFPWWGRLDKNGTLVGKEVSTWTSSETPHFLAWKNRGSWRGV